MGGGRWCLTCFNGIINSLSALVSCVSFFELHYIMLCFPLFQMLIVTDTNKDPFGVIRTRSSRALVGDDGHVTLLMESPDDFIVISSVIKKNDLVAVCGEKCHQQIPVQCLKVREIEIKDDEICLHGHQRKIFANRKIDRLSRSKESKNKATNKPRKRKPKANFVKQEEKDDWIGADSISLIVGGLFSITKGDWNEEEIRLLRQAVGGKEQRPIEKKHALELLIGTLILVFVVFCLVCLACWS